MILKLVLGLEAELGLEAAFPLLGLMPGLPLKSSPLSSPTSPGSSPTTLGANRDYAMF